MTEKDAKILGFVKWTLRNEDGSVADEGEGQNLVVDYGKIHPSRDSWNNYPVGRYLYIADDEHDLVAFASQLFSSIGTDSNFAGVRLDTGTGGWNRSTLTRTVSGTFLAPSATRTVTHIGLAFGESSFNSTSAANHGLHGALFSGLKINPAITQTTSQTLEVTYQVVVLPRVTKGIERFPRSPGRDTDRVWLEYRLVDHGTNQTVGSFAPFTFGRNHFVDEGAFMQMHHQNNVHYHDSFCATDGNPPSFPGRLTPTSLGYFADSHAVLASEDDRYNGAWGMTTSSYNINDVTKDETSFAGWARSLTHGYYPLARDHGKVGPLVFAHPVGRSHMFNEVAIDKTGQGDLEIEGPYIPTDIGSGSPMHWCYAITVTDSGDADPGTEGRYVMHRVCWFSYPFMQQADALTLTESLTYIADDGGSGNSAITRPSGDFVADGWDPDMRLEISGTASNNGTTFRIITVEPTKLTLEGVVLTGEGPVSSTLDGINLFHYDGNSDRLIGGSSGVAGWQTEDLRQERNDTTFGTSSGRYNLYRTVYDGIDSFWGLHFRETSHGDGSRYSACRWRAMTGEQEFRGTPNNFNSSLGANNNGNPWTDTTRFVRHTDGSPVGDTGGTSNQPFGLATDRAGLIFFGQRNTNEVSADNKVFIIDNSKPGRWYQRPSGSITGGGVFTVDAGDEIHDMFPFVSGDAGAEPKIRIVGSTQGNDGVFPVATFTNANEVTLTGSFTAESNLTWHWTTIDESEPAVGEIRGLLYDHHNGRLWALGSLGLKHSDDDGQTWSTLLDENTATTPLIDSEARTAIGVGSLDAGHGGYDYDTNGDIYWISFDSGGANKYWVNKLELNSGIGVDSVHSRINLTDDFPGSNKPTSLSNIYWEKGVDNPNQRGALWFNASDTGSAEDAHYRMTIDAGVISAAPQIAKIIEHDIQTINNIPSGYDTVFRMITLPDGRTMMKEFSSSVNWLMFDPKYADDPDNAYTDLGSAVYDSQNSFSGFGQEGFRQDGTFWLTCDNNEHGFFGSMHQRFRYTPGDDVSGQSGAAASIVAGAAAGQVRITGLTGMTANSVGRHMTFTGAATAANNTTLIIAAFNSATEVDVFAPNGVTGDANNGSISWQEKESEWVLWGGTENQFDAYYGTDTKGRAYMHSDFRELRDNVKVKFTEAGGATAPADEFVEGETFTFIVSFGEHKTNVEDMTANYYQGYLKTEQHVEQEAIKNATGPGSKNAYFQADSGFTTATAAILDPAYLLDANSKNWGTLPYHDYTLYGLGLSVDSDPSGSTTRPSWRAGLDLGAATEIHKLVVQIAFGSTGFTQNQTRFSPTDTDRYSDMRLFSGPDAVTLPTEIDATFRWPPDDVTNTNGEHIHIFQGNYAWNNSAYGIYTITFDLAGAGLSVGQRTARFWEVSAAMDSGAGNDEIHLSSIYALDASDNYIGITSNQYVDEVFESDFRGMNISEAFWIQNVHGGGDPGAGTVISTTDDGDGDGFTDRVTLDSGLFDTASIDITKDFLAWEEPGAPTASGYLRVTDRPGLASPRSLTSSTNAETVARTPQGPQAMSRIIDTATPGQIIVEDDMIPDNLSGVEWEVRRPCIITNNRNSTDGDALHYDQHTGSIDHQPANESSSRRFRVTRKVIFRK